MTPTKRDARVAGLLYLLMVVTGVFDIMVVPSRLFVRGNPAATASNILAHESLFRLDIVVGIVSVLAFVFTVLALYHLLQGVNRRLAAIMVVLVLIQVPQAFLSELTHLAALAFLRGPDYLAVFDKPQREALAMLSLHLNSQASIVSQTFWGVWLFPLAWLVWRSAFIPRVLGGWLVVNGLAYLANSFTGLLAPQYVSVVSPITLPCLMGEVAFTLWLLVVGVKWRAPREVGEPV
jgi:hypothetical protein